MIVVLTYDAPHRKTQDMLWRMTHHDVRVVALPFVERPARRVLAVHRPAPIAGAAPLGIMDAWEVCGHVGFPYYQREYTELAATLDEFQPDLVLIAGAGILPTDVVENFVVLNSHPGYLPQVRGLDALKWAIYENLPIGVTLHRCAVDGVADAGTLVEQTFVPVYNNDSFHSVAQRVYERELDLLVRAPDLYPGRNEPILPQAHQIVRRRMPAVQEAAMLARFEALRVRSPMAP